MDKLRYLNLGCGITYDERWTNVDFVSTGPGVIAHNLLSGIPFADASFRVVYHSHVLEHFPKAKAKEFLSECYRVLEPGGIIRVVIPDLEQIARNYITFLEQSLSGNEEARKKYEWTVIEMLDQMVRNEGGGEMLKYVADTSKKNDEFLLSRNGHEMERLFKAVRGDNPPTSSAPVKTPSIFTRAKNKIKRTAIMKLLGPEYALLQQARFRNGGEIHQWMYDRYSLGELLKSVGFKNPLAMTAFESKIPDWNSFHLDGSDRIVRKPDSLFMEAIK